MPRPALNSYIIIFHCNLQFYFPEFSVGNLECTRVDLKGLGVLNWVVKKVMLGVIEQNISNLLMRSVRELIRKEFNQVSLVDQMFTSFKIL